MRAHAAQQGKVAHGRDRPEFLGLPELTRSLWAPGGRACSKSSEVSPFRGRLRHGTTQAPSRPAPGLPHRRGPLPSNFSPTGLGVEQVGCAQVINLSDCRTGSSAAPPQRGSLPGGMWRLGWAVRCDCLSQEFFNVHYCQAPLTRRSTSRTCPTTGPVRDERARQVLLAGGAPIEPVRQSDRLGQSTPASGLFSSGWRAEARLSGARNHQRGRTRPLRGNSLP